MDEALTTSTHDKGGGWRTFPYVIGGMMGIGVAVYGVASNLVVYLMQQYNVGSITATQINNVVAGCTNLAPVVAAVLSDSGLGPSAVVSTSTAACLLGMLLFILTATLPSLRPAPCSLDICEAPTAVQLILLYIATALNVIGVGGTRFNTATLGANQFDDASDQATFFNWYFIALYLSAILGQTGIVYLQDNMSWGWGYGLCATLTAVSLCCYHQGSRYYRQSKAQDNPFKGLWRALISAIETRMTKSAKAPCNYYKLEDGEGDHRSQVPSQDLSAAQDLKTVIRLLPLISTALLVGATVSLQSSLTVLQALVMDRHIGPHFEIPAGSITVLVLVAAAFSIFLLDRAIYPAWQRLTGQPPTALQRIGLGHIINIFAMVASAIVESNRLKALQSHEPMSAVWLVLPLVLVGLGEALHFPGNVSLYYQEFAASLRSTATGLVSLTAGLGTYLGIAALALVRRLTGWLDDDINRSRVDNVYWMLGVVAFVNFVYLLICARLYKRQTV